MADLTAVEKTCQDCAHAFVVPVDEQRFLSRLAEKRGGPWVLPRRCHECRHARRVARYDEPVLPNAPDETLVCRDCGKEFTFGGRDREFFVRNGFSKPKRCRPCRQAKRLDERKGLWPARLSDNRQA